MYSEYFLLLHHVDQSGFKLELAHTYSVLVLISTSRTGARSCQSVWLKEVRRAALLFAIALPTPITFTKLSTIMYGE
jgi:hypothetical protein